MFPSVWRGEEGIAPTRLYSIIFGLQQERAERMVGGLRESKSGRASSSKGWNEVEFLLVLESLL